MRKEVLLLICLLACAACSEHEPKEEPVGGCGMIPESPRPHVFQEKCAPCHVFNKDLTGPKMQGVLDRVPSEEWLRQFITHQDSLIEIGDSTTLRIMQWSEVEWNHNFTDLEEHELDTLLNYIIQ